LKPQSIELEDSGRSLILHLDTKTGPQQVVQFVVQYRYLSESGAANPIVQTPYVDNNGQTKTGAFSDWK